MAQNETQLNHEVIDPVCGMTIDIDRAIGIVEHKGRTYYFCSPSCVEKFKADPDKYLSAKPSQKEEYTKAIASPRSSAEPLRPTRVASADCFNKGPRTSGASRSHHGVSTTPGDTALTRNGRSSRASGFTIDSIAPLIAASPAVPGLAARAEIADTNVREPSLRREGIAAWAAWN